MADKSKILAFIEKCSVPSELKSLIENAQRQGDSEVALAAFRKLVSLVPAERLGSVEHDFWQTVNAFEFLLTEERGKTTRLARTRQKLARVGVIETLKDWALDVKPTEGFKMLLERGLPELTGEAVVLRHPEAFDDATRDAAEKKLIAANVDVASVLAPRD